MTLLHDILDRSAGRSPGRVALRHQGEELSYASLGDLARTFAGALAARGIGRGDRVVLHLPNRPDTVALMLACSRIGAVFVPVSPALKARQLFHVLNDSGARLLCTRATLLPSLPELRVQCPALERVVLTDPLAGALDVPAGLRLDDIAEFHQHRGAALEARVGDTDLAALMYTSGSTGRAKGVMVTHRNLVSGADVVAGYLGNHEDDRILAALPLSFDYGLSQVTTALRVGACAVLTQYSMPAATLRELYDENITGFAGVPTMWAHLAAGAWPASAPPRLRYITNSGGALQAPLIQRLTNLLPRTRIFCMYGLTEAFRSTYLDPAELGRRTGSIGKAVPGQEVLVIGPDGRRCAPDEPGELVHRGSFVSAGYWNDPALTAQRFRPLPPGLAGTDPGELAVWSGDRVRADADGFLWFLARNDQQIKTSGVRVSPTEVEDAVVEVPGVIEAVAVGIPDEVLGAGVAVALVGKDHPDDGLVQKVRDHCRAQLPTYMMPVEIRVFPELPRTPTGKPDRAAIAAVLAAPPAPADDSALPLARPVRKGRQR